MSVLFLFCWKQILLDDVKFPVIVYQGIKYTRKLCSYNSYNYNDCYQYTLLCCPFLLFVIFRASNFRQAKIKLVIGRQSLLFLLFEFDCGSSKKNGMVRLSLMQIVNIRIEKFRNLSINSCSYCFFISDNI